MTEPVTIEELRAAAEAYHSLGLAIVPFVDNKETGKKEPKIEKWGKWQTQPQTKQEFEDLHIENYTMFGVVCGTKTIDDVYFSVIDRDIKDKKLAPETLEKTLEAIKKMPTTRREKTRSGGQHLLYYSRTQVKGQKLNAIGMELLALGQLCVMCPSEGYSEELSSDVIATVENVENVFLEAIEGVGPPEQETKPAPSSEALETVKPKPLRPCFTKLMEKDHLEHLEKVALIYELHYCGKTKEEIADIFQEHKAWEQPPNHKFDPKKTTEQIRYTVQKASEGQFRYKKDTLEDLGICFEECPLQNAKDCRRKQRIKKTTAKKEEEKPIVFKPFMELPDGKLAEQAFDGKEVFFLVYDPQTASITKVCEVELEGFTLKPIDNDEVRQQTVLLPGDVEEYESEEKLTEEIRDYLNRWHEAPNQLSRTVDIYYCYLTYIYDLTPQLPYRRYLAPWGRGKSAWLETLGWICYRGIVLAGSDTDKSVVRKMNNWRGTALIDEADFGDSTLYAFLTKILNIGYDRKTGYYHRSDDNDPNKILSYGVYCPKLLATREKYKDLALESRCLTTIGRQNTNPVPLFRMDKFLAESQTLRNKLMMWRFRNYGKIKLAASQLEDKGMAAKVYDGADNVSSRVKQVILPLWLIAGDSMKQTLTEMAKTFDNLLKIEDPDYLLELQAKDAVQKIIEDYGKNDEKNPETVNIRNVMNILYEDPPENKKILYAVPLNLISRRVLVERGAKPDEITVSDVTSTSKSLKGVFESVLGFHIHIGKKRSRVVTIPSDWAGKEAKPEGGLDDFV